MNEVTDEQHESSKKRIVGRPFPKGVSGNPGGRPRRAKLQDKIDEIMTDDDLKEIIRTVLKKAKRGQKDHVKILLEHRFGKPVQETELVGDKERPVVIFQSTVPIADDEVKE